VSNVSQQSRENSTSDIFDFIRIIFDMILDTLWMIRYIYDVIMDILIVILVLC